MYIHPDARLNGFRLVKIPSAETLVKQMGIKETNLHDGSNGDEYCAPDNPSGVDNLDRLQQVGNILNQAALAYQQQQQAKPDNAADSRQQPEVEAPATT